VIDARQPVIAQLLKFARAAWERSQSELGVGSEAEEVGGGFKQPRAPKSLVFDTTDRDYFKTMQTIMAKHGWTVGRDFFTCHFFYEARGCPEQN
jgi:hypothetical protein